MRSFVQVDPASESSVAEDVLRHQLGHETEQRGSAKNLGDSMNSREFVAIGMAHRAPTAATSAERRLHTLPARGLASVRERHDALERALADCLWAFSELASASGQSDRGIRLRSAAELLQRDPPTLGPASLRSEAGGPAGRPPRSTLLRKPCSLTQREQEVARLIADGFTNRQIAADLRISERTADTHVQNILNRLGLVSRAQVAAWVADRAARRSSSW
jgi:DNA-binding CsgD family transcriptional regulator